jgi:hypothetical protein
MIHRTPRRQPGSAPPTTDLRLYTLTLFLRCLAWRRVVGFIRLAERVRGAQELHASLPSHQDLRYRGFPRVARRPVKASGSQTENLIHIATIARAVYFFALPKPSSASFASSSSLLAAGLSSASRYWISGGVTSPMPCS